MSIYYVGQAVSGGHHNYDGWVVVAEAAKAETFTIGAQGLAENDQDIEIVTRASDGTLTLHTDLHDGLLDSWEKSCPLRPDHIQDISIEEALQLKEQAERAALERYRKASPPTPPYGESLSKYDSETSAVTPVGVVMRQWHEKRGFEYFLVVLDERVERDVFTKYRDECKSRKGWYSRAWNGIPGGFAFKDQDGMAGGKEMAESFLLWCGQQQ